MIAGENAVTSKIIPRWNQRILWTGTQTAKRKEVRRQMSDELKSRIDGTMVQALSIDIQELTPERVIATMPVNASTRQPAGLLHGGASVALAETVASIGTWNLIDHEKQAAVGLEINANHIRSKSDGVVTATATPLHKGRTTMVWDIKIVDEDQKLICISRCTVAVVNQKPGEE